MRRNPWRIVALLVVMSCISITMVGRTEGFENIRTVQFLLIFVAGALVGLAIGIVRGMREAAVQK